VGTDHGATDTPRNGSRLFTVRVRAEDTGEGIEHRGSARDVETGAFVHFRTWDDLTAFLAARVDEHQHRAEEPNMTTDRAGTTTVEGTR
jgi:hypothetical protein